VQDGFGTFTGITDPADFDLEGIDIGNRKIELGMGFGRYASEIIGFSFKEPVGPPRRQTTVVLVPTVSIGRLGT
jgi:hypothetical protein